MNVQRPFQSRLPNVAFGDAAPNKFCRKKSGKLDKIVVEEIEFEGR